MTARNYSSVAVQAQLTQAVDSTETNWQVSDVTGWPAVPFTLVADTGLGTEEAVTAVAVGGLTATVLRGEDGTPASPHSIGATLIHSATARDFQEPNDHVNALTTVHGVAGALVGTSDVQTLDNKTFLSSDGTTVPLRAKAATGQVSALIDARNDSNTVVWSVGPTGRESTPGVDSSSQSIFTAGTATTTPLIVKGAASQTANLISAQDASGTEVFSVSASGVVLAQAGGSTSVGALSATTGTFSGTITGTAANFSGQVQAGTLKSTGAVQGVTAAITGASTMGNINSSGNVVATGGVAANSLTVTNSATIGGTLNAGGANVPVSSAGTVNVSVTGAATGTATVTFPVSRFAQPPIVMCTLQNAPTGSATFSARAISITPTGFTVQVNTGDGVARTASAMTVGWYAVQMSTLNAAG